MDDKTKEINLKTLDKNEAKIVYQVCQGIESKNLAYREDLGFKNVGGKTIERHMTSIYKKLEIGGRKNKEATLVIEYCPIIRKLLPTIQEVNRWIPSKPPVVTPTSQPQQTVNPFERMVVKEPWQARLENVAQNRNYQLIAAAVLLIALIIFIASLSHQHNQPTPTATIALNLSTPNLPILFQDNFENGLSSQWVVLSGLPLIANGHLTTNQPTWIQIGDNTWKNYSVELDALAFGFEPGGYGGPKVSMRFKDFQNTVTVQIAPYVTYWEIGIEANQSIPNTENRSPKIDVNRTNHITVLVEGDTYTLLSNAEYVSSVGVPGYPEGGVAIYLDPSTMIDNVRVNKLP